MILLIRPSVAADRGPMAAAVIAAIDQQPANAGGAHLAEGDLLAGVGHGAIEARARPESKIYFQKAPCPRRSLWAFLWAF